MSIRADAVIPRTLDKLDPDWRRAPAWTIDNNEMEQHLDHVTSLPWGTWFVCQLPHGSVSLWLRDCRIEDHGARLVVDASGEIYRPDRRVNITIKGAVFMRGTRIWAVPPELAPAFEMMIAHGKGERVIEKIRECLDDHEQ